MTFRNLLLFLFSIFILEFSFSQVKYNRSSLTIISLETNDLMSQNMADELHQLPVPDKFYCTKINNKFLNPRIRRINSIDFAQEISPDTMMEWFAKHKIAQQVLSVWFNRQKDGTFNIDTLKARGMYNANDNEFQRATTSKRGINALMDEGLKLIDQSYILVFDFHNITSFEDFYRLNNTPKKERTQTGFIGDAKIYVYKLVFDENTANDFFEKFWITPGDPMSARKKTDFENHRFDFEVKTKTITRIQASQSTKGLIKVRAKKTDREFLREMAQSALAMTLDGLEYYEPDVQVKAMVSDIKPIAAKIGKKEDLKFESRYFVYENQQDKEGNTDAKRIGVVKAYKVMDNREVTSGQTRPSLFYQIAGKKIDPFGMYLVSKDSWGLNLASGIQVGGKAGFQFRGEYYISKNLGRLVPAGRSGKCLTSVSFYTEFGVLNESQYPLGKVAYSSLTFGIGKSIYLGRNFHLTPFWGIGYEQAKWDELYGGSVSEPRMEYGLRSGVNLRHNIQLMPGFSMVQSMGQASEQDADGNTLGTYFGPAFDGRSGPAFSLGLRIML